MQDIRNELNNNIKVKIVTPVHSTQVMVRHSNRESLILTGKFSIQKYRRAQERMLREAATADPEDVELPTKIEILYTKIAKGYYELSNEIPIDMSESDKTAYGNGWHTYR